MEAMSLPSVQHYMQVLEVKIQDCRPLFDILDDGDGRITIPEFCKGLMQLKGQARALDIVMLQRENKKVLLECQDWIGNDCNRDLWPFIGQQLGTVETWFVQLESHHIVVT